MSENKKTEEPVNEQSNDQVNDQQDTVKATNKVVPLSNTKNKIPSKLTNANPLNNINFLDPDQVLAAENFLVKLSRSKKGGLDSVNDGLAILLRAKDLQLPFSTCIEHIHVINGKTGIDIHIVKALMLRAGVTWECIHDYTPLYEYTDGINIYNENLLPSYCKKVSNKNEATIKTNDSQDDEIVYVYPVKWYADFNGNQYRDYNLNSNIHRVVSTKSQAIELAKNNIIGVYRIPSVPIDYITEYKFTRTINNKLMTSIGRFSFSNAIQADLLIKDTYIKYVRQLVGHRAYTYGARDIASDVLFGCLETTELKIMSNITLTESDIIDIETE